MKPVSIFCIFITTALFGGGPALDLQPYTFKNAKSQTVEAEMGRFKVRENRQATDSRQIELAFVRFKTTAENPGSPIVYLAGGPGGSGVGTARGSRFPLFMAMREAGDVIAFDQRGTGNSYRIPACKERWHYPLDRVLERKALQTAMEDNARACAAFWREQGVDLNGYNTLESAHDLDDLRRALGVEKLTIWGISYGTHLALAYAKYYPDRVDKLIVAGLEGPNHTVKLPRDSQALMEQIGAMAAHQGYPDFLEKVKTVLDRLEQQPVEVTVQNPSAGGEVTLKIGKYDIQAATAALLGGPRRFKVLPTWYDEMAAGDFSSVAAGLLSFRSGGTSGMSAAMDAASGSTAARTAMIASQAKHTLLGGAINFPPYPGLAKALAVDDLGDDFRRSKHLQTPALFISGTLDGRTAVNNAVDLLPFFPNGKHLIIHGAGHSDPLFLSSPKIGETMLAFAKGREITVDPIHLDPISFKPQQAINLDQAQLQVCAGTYVINPQMTATVTAAPNHLVVDVTGYGVFNFFPKSKTEFFMKDAPITIVFESTQNTITELVINAEGNILKGKRQP